MSAKWFLSSAFRSSLVLPSMTLLALTFCIPVGAAQRPATQAAAEGESDKPPQPEALQLKTADGVRLAVTYYPGTNGKETVPIVLLHMRQRRGSDYTELAKFLQAQGHAVLVPDLRGHGDSTVKTVVGRTGNLTRLTLDAASMSRIEFANMVQYDMPRLKWFLVEKNNAGELNLERLCVVGAELGASVALHWARFNWSLPPKGNKKQGQDVKVLILISPESSMPGLTLNAALAGRAPRVMIWDPQLKKVFKDPDGIDFRGPVELDFRREVSIMIAAGRGSSKAVSEATRLQRMLKPYHPDPSPGADAAEKDLLYGTLDTSLQGTKILGVKDLNLQHHILRFIERRAVKRPFSWALRTDPYG